MRHKTSPAQPAAQNLQSPSDLARQIFQLISRGALQEASLVSEHALVLHPKSAEILNAAAVAAIHAKFPQQAEALWRQSIKIAPGQAIAYLNLGKFYFNTKRLSDAEPLLRKALALNPRSAEALNALGALQQAQGDFLGAHATYVTALKLDPGKAETLNNLGICLTEMGQYAEAERIFLRLSELPGQHATALARQGMLAEAQGAFGKAREHFEAALLTAPSNVITATQYAGLLRKTGDAEHAVKVLEALQTRLATADPLLLRALAQCELARGNDSAAQIHLQRAQMSALDDLETLQMRAELAARSKDLDTLDTLLAELPLRAASEESAAVETARMQLLAGRPSAALACVQSAQGALGKTAALLCLEGDAYIALHAPDQAEAAFRQALQLTQANIKAHLGLGFALIARAAYPEALIHYEQSLQRHPGNALLRAGLAQTLLELQDLKRAETILEPLYAAQPQNAVIATTYSHYARLTGKLTDALKAAQDAVRQSPNERAANTALIAAYEEMGNLDEAIRLAREFVAAHPADSDTRLRLAMLLLAQGQFNEGWAAYESRLISMLDTDHPYTRAPRWQGEPLQGKTLLVAHEQGMGDELQFFRYLSPLQDRFECAVHLVCKPPLHALLTAQQICPVHSYEELRSEDLPDHDYWVPLMSIPHLARTAIPDIPQVCPYMHVPDHKICQWQDRLAQDACEGRLKVGIIWKGNPNHQNDARRSLPSLGVLAPLLELPGIRFFNLQKDTSTSESASFAAQYGLVTLAPEIIDVLDTAAIMTQLDLVISIDSMPAHLAGALGAPCWVMLPASAEWRWMTNRDDTPWYPRTRLFRQRTPGNWASVVTCMRDSLDHLAREEGIIQNT